MGGWSTLTAAINLETAKPMLDGGIREIVRHDRNTIDNSEQTFQAESNAHWRSAKGSRIMQAANTSREPRKWRCPRGSSGLVACGRFINREFQ